MTKTEIAALQNLLDRLRSPRLGAAEGYCEGVDDSQSRLYLQSWIIGPLELLLPGPDRNPDLARRMLRR